MSRAETPAAFARSRARAPGTLQITTAVSAGIDPFAHPSRIACRFEPEPEASTPRRISGDDHFWLRQPGSALHRPDLERRLPALRQHLDRARDRPALDDGAHPDAHV